jgi:DNA-binding response OmpR family regulator
LSNKTVLLIDDDQSFMEPLVDALNHEGFRVLTARTGEEGLAYLARESVDLVTVDIMLDPGESLRQKVKSQTTGVYLCRQIKTLYPRIDIFCISVVSDPETIAPIRQLGIRILTKGETSLRTVLNLLRSKLTGVAYTTRHDADENR